MDSINIWNQFFIHWKKITLVAVIFLSALTSQSQDATFNKDKKWFDRNLPNYDDRVLHYGFTLGINSTRFRPVASPDFTDVEDSLISIKAPRTTGFSLGFILSLKLGEYFDFRVLPTFAFYQRDVNYEFLNGFKSTQTTESTFIEIPLVLKYKSQRHGNTRMYVVGGLKPGIEAGAKKKEKSDRDLRTSNIDLSIDYGFGFDIYYPLFKFSPELRFSHGLVNMRNVDDNVFSSSLQKLTSHTITLLLHFE